MLAYLEKNKLEIRKVKSVTLNDFLDSMLACLRKIKNEINQTNKLKWNKINIYSNIYGLEIF